MRRLLLAALLAAGCGGGTDGRPAAPPTTPAPAPAPAPPPPTWPAVVYIASQPSDREEGSYRGGDVIGVTVDFDSRQNVTVEGNPRLAIEIGEHLRLADFAPYPSGPPLWGQRFRYEVRPDDLDADGISIRADALDFSEGAFLDEHGLEIAVEIRTVNAYSAWREYVEFEPGENVNLHRVLGQPEPRVCTDERRRAMNHSRFVREWDGTPIRVDIVNSFPDHVTRAEVATLLESIDLVDEKIEAQLGYRILEAGDVLPVPEGMRPGWNLITPQFRRTCQLPRDRGQILGYYTDASNDPPGPGADGQANPGCGTFTFLKRFMTIWPVPGDTSDALTLHELFHVLGYVHSDNDEDRIANGNGVRMSYTLTREVRPGADAVRWHDIDLLRCIFPEGG